MKATPARPLTARSATNRKGRRMASAGVALLAGGLLAAACGSSGTTTGAGGTSTTAAPAATAAPTTATTTMTSPSMSAGGQTGAMASFGPACAKVPASGAGSFSGMAQAPAATAASNNPLLSTLVTAVGKAGLVDTLNSTGPFTIFAPTNDAFAALPPATLNKVLADKDLLTKILTYHVVSGSSLDAKQLGTAGQEKSVEGASLMFGNNGTTVNGANVVCSDVTTANATVHIIDKVLLPPDVASAMG